MGGSNSRCLRSRSADCGVREGLAGEADMDLFAGHRLIVTSPFVGLCAMGKSTDSRTSF